MKRQLIYRLIFLGITLLMIPVAPLLVIFAGTSSPEYIIRGTLNLDVSSIEYVGPVKIYMTYLAKLMMLDFGRSTATGHPVLVMLLQALGESLKIVVPAVIISIVVGTLLGIATAWNAKMQSIWGKTQFVFYIPMIVVAYLWLYLFSLIGFKTENFKHIGAIIVLAAYPCYVVTRSVQKTIGETESSEYFQMHKSTGFSEAEIWLKFCRNFLVLDYLSLIENVLIYMFGFLFFAETPFGIQGLGYRFVLAVQRYDYPVIIAVILFMTILFNMICLLVDLARKQLDPRIAE